MVQPSDTKFGSWNSGQMQYEGNFHYKCYRGKTAEQSLRAKLQESPGQTSVKMPSSIVSPAYTATQQWSALPNPGLLVALPADRTKDGEPLVCFLEYHGLRSQSGLDAWKGILKGERNNHYGIRDWQYQELVTWTESHLPNSKNLQVKTYNNTNPEPLPVTKTFGN